MNRPPAFVRPPNSGSGVQSPSSMSSVPRNSIPPPVPLNQKVPFNLPPKAPPPFNYKQPSNPMNQSTAISNTKYSSPSLGTGTMVNGHFHMTSENPATPRDYASKNQLTSRISPVMPGTSSGNQLSMGINQNTTVVNATLNQNNSLNMLESNINTSQFKNHDNFLPGKKMFASSDGNVKPTHNSSVSEIEIANAGLSTGLQNTSMIHDIGTKGNKEMNQEMVTPEISTAATSLANMPASTSTVSSSQSDMITRGQSVLVPESFVYSSQASPVVTKADLSHMPSTNVTSLSQQSNPSNLPTNTTGLFAPSSAIKSPYTPVSPPHSATSTPQFFPSSGVSQAYVSSSQHITSPSFQPNSIHNVNTFPSSNAELQNKPRYPAPITSGYTTIPSPLSQQMPIVSPSSNISAVRSPYSCPPIPGSTGTSKFATASTRSFVHSTAHVLPPSMSSPTVGPIMRIPAPPVNVTSSNIARAGPPPVSMVPPVGVASPNIVKTGPPPVSMVPPIGAAYPTIRKTGPPPISMTPLHPSKPPIFPPIPSTYKEVQRPPLQAPVVQTNGGSLPPPPTSFPIQHSVGHTPSHQQSYSSASAYKPSSASYPAQFSSQSDTTNVGTHKYPVQQQPSSINQLSRQLGGLSVTQQGWNKGWGTASIDLMQQRWVLPPDGAIPPKPCLAQENVSTCSLDAFRCTFTKVPESNSVLQKARLPFGILVHPFKDVEQLTIVNGCTIVRCGGCRTYINPFIVFKGERKWECNLCFRVNDLPEEFQYDPVSRTYGDPSGGPECRESTIEYIAPQEYLLRPPQPACYLYVLDTSRQAIETGYLQIVCEILLSRLGSIPGDRRTLIGFITFSTSVQFYMIAEDQKMVNVLDVGDINNVFLPSPQDLLVNLNENRELVEELLMNLPEDVAYTHNTQTCLGAAIIAAHKLLAPIGGRITVMAATLPTLGPGSLKSREDPNQRAAKDINNLGPATDFYKKYALDCSAQQIAVDLFTFNSQYIDLATITGISKFSGGCIHHYPGMSVAKNTPNVFQFRNCFDRYVTRKIGFEAVMRIRATRGLAITNFHGNFFVRSTDLLSLPNINPDAGFGMQVIIEEQLHNIRQACFQAALLYTSSNGERRIRVHTMCLPVSANILDIIISADQQAIVGFLSKLAVDRCLTSQMSDAREAVVNACSDAFEAYKASVPSSVGLVSPICLQLLPMYCLAILKSVPLRYGMCTKLDDRVFAMCEFKSLPLKILIKYIYPDLFAIHNLTEEGAINFHDLVVPQPGRLHLSAEFIDRSGAYLMDMGDTIIIYIRNYISSNWLNDVLGIPNFAAIPQPMHDDPLPELDNSTSELVRNFVSYLQRGRPYTAPLSIIKEDSPERYRFIQKLIEDRSEASHSYVEFLQYVKSQMK